jgi:hypothetical protein
MRELLLETMQPRRARCHHNQALHVPDNHSQKWHPMVAWLFPMKIQQNAGLLHQSSGSGSPILPPQEEAKVMT